VVISVCSKQQKGSRLDRVVERHRSSVVREIIGHLRGVTGQELGGKPEEWIQRYAEE
jgi:hypothetical protein